MKQLNYKYQTISLLILFSFALHILLSCNYLSDKVICKADGTISIEKIDKYGNCEHAASGDFASEELFIYSHCEDIQLTNHLADDYILLVQNNFKTLYHIQADIFPRSAIDSNNYFTEINIIPFQVVSFPITIKSTSSLLI